MTLDDEIREVENMVQVARDSATWHLERATKDLHLRPTGQKHYEDFLDATLRNAGATLARCRDMVAAPALAAEASTSVVSGLLAGVRESLRLMYLAGVVLEQLAGSAPHGAAAPATEPPALRSCSFCGQTEAETRLVAGPAANICGPCTRLVCGVLGIALGDDCHGVNPSGHG